jgi:hypothetical protein
MTFFQPGHTYAREHHGRRIEFHVLHVATAPDCDFPTAFGWRKDPEINVLLPMDADDFHGCGWTDVTSDAPPPADRATLVDRVREVLARSDGFDFDSLEPHDYQIQAAALLAVLPVPAGRAAVLTEAADRFDQHAKQILDGVGDKAVFVAKALRDQAAVWSEAAETLRRLAAEANPEPAAEDRPIAYRSYGARALYCVICARQEDRCEPVTQVDEKDVCSFCDGNLLAVASRTLGGVIAKYLKETP